MEMQTSSQWNVLIGLFYFHFNKVSPPLLFSSPPHRFCPLHFSQAVPSGDTLAPSRLPVNGSVNSVILRQRAEGWGLVLVEGWVCVRSDAAGQKWHRKLKEEEMGRWKTRHEKEKISCDYLNASSGALATGMRCISDQQSLQTVTTNTAIQVFRIWWSCRIERVLGSDECVIP